MYPTPAPQHRKYDFCPSSFAFDRMSCKKLGFPGGLDGKESTCHARDLGPIPGSGRSPGEGNGNLLHDSCLGNPMERGAWPATVQKIAKESDTT